LNQIILRLALTNTLFFILVPVWCAGPLMDGSIMDDSQNIALNSINDGKFTEAISNEEKALKIAQEQYGPLHPSLVPFYNSLGSLYRYVADYGKAEQDYKWGLALLEENFGPNNPQQTESLENLAALYIDLGRFDEAELEAKKALQLQENGANSDPEKLAKCQSLLGHVELNLRDYVQAQKLFQKAMENIEKTASADPSFTINALNFQAQAYELGKNNEQARLCLEKSLAIAQKNFHSDDIQVADTMNRLADFFHSQKLDEKANPLYDAAIKIDRRYVGSVYTYESLPYLKRLAKAFYATGDIKSSEALWQKSLQTEKDVYGPKHPQVALDLIQLARAEWDLQEKANAKKDVRESIDMLKFYFPDNHPLVIEAKIQFEKFKK